MTLTLTPAALRPHDDVLVNRSWWRLIKATQSPLDGSWRLKLIAGGDLLEVVRPGDARITVDRARVAS